MSQANHARSVAETISSVRCSSVKQLGFQSTLKSAEKLGRATVIIGLH